jgi:hypothetical protein
MLREVASLAVGGSGKLVRHTSERMSASVS